MDKSKAKRQIVERLRDTAAYFSALGVFSGIGMLMEHIDNPDIVRLAVILMVGCAFYLWDYLAE